MRGNNSTRQEFYATFILLTEIIHGNINHIYTIKHT